MDMQRMVLAAALVVMCGCSVAFVTQPPIDLVAASQARTTGRIKCTRAPAAPTIDTVVGVAAIAGTVALSESGSVDVIDPSSDAIVGVTIALNAIGSAIYGYVETRRCRELYRAYDRERRLYKQGLPRRNRGCNGDIECKGSRLCQDGMCVEPR